MTNIELLPERGYRVRVGKIEIGGFVMESEWEGLAKLVHPKGFLIIAQNPTADFSRVFSEIFGNQGDFSRKALVIVGTPALIDELGLVEMPETERPTT